MMSPLSRVAAVGLAAATLACASTQRPAALSQAQTIYDSLESSGARQRVEGGLIRTREAITLAQTAVDRNQNQEYVNGLAHVALRTAQTTEAQYQQLVAQQAADSLQRARLTAQLSQTQAERERLAQQQQQSQAELAALAQQADSLRRANEEANARLNAALTQLRTLVSEITNLRETSRGIVISLSDILFDVNRATLKPGADANIQRIAGVLKQYPDKQISVEGHTDATGSDSYNMKLSQDRAASVRNALVRGGVSPELISSKGLGETQPVASNDTPAGRQQNRRVEIVVLGAGTVADAQNAGAPRAPGAPGTTGDSTRTIPDSGRMPPDSARMMFDSTRTPRIPPDSSTGRPPVR
jgi:outer membrane protein OmpA-like peptidoglycan-associated protein